MRRSFPNLEELTMHLLTGRPFAKLSTAIALIVLGLTSNGLAASANENEVRPA
jgi:hypothetical protein